MGAALEAPLGIDFACLENVLGSWLMRLHHSHEAYAFHGASSLGNYAIAGVIATLPGTAIVVTAKACLSAMGYKKFTGWYGFVLLFAFFSGQGCCCFCHRHCSWYGHADGDAIGYCERCWGGLHHIVDGSFCSYLRALGTGVWVVL